MTVPIWSFNSAVNRKHSPFQPPGMKTCLHCWPKPLFYKWKPQRQLCLTGYGLAEQVLQKLFLHVPFLSMWLFTVKPKQTNKYKQTDMETKSWTNQGGKQCKRHCNTAESFRSCHSSEFMHINGGLVVNLGNTWAESKGSGAEKEVWHVQQLCGCSTAGLFDLLYSGVTGPWQAARLQQAEAEAEAGRAHMVSVRAWERAPATEQRTTQTKCWNISQNPQRPGQHRSENWSSRWTELIKSAPRPFERKCKLLCWIDNISTLSKLLGCGRAPPRLTASTTMLLHSWLSIAVCIFYHYRGWLPPH